MRYFTIATVLATLAVASAAFSPAAQACSARGRFCSYPLWAANAFEGPRGRVPEASRPTVVSSPDRPTRRRSR